MKSIKIGLAQLLVEGGEPERNLERAGALIHEAAKAKCDIVLLPETLDFAWTHPSSLQEALPIPGKYSDYLCNKAREYNIYICAGLTEKTNEGNFNTAIFIDPEGKIILKYHKINLLGVEQPYYNIGHTLNVVDTKFGKIGVNICADNYIDGLYIGHTLAKMGAQIILSPSSWTVDYSVTEEEDPYREKWIRPYSVLANLYDIVVVGTTSVGYIVGGPYEGKKSVGCSLVVGKNGIIKQGEFNEFAGELIIAEFQVPEHQIKGTDISNQLKDRGYEFDHYNIV